MSNKLMRLAMGVMALPLLAACATKGYVRDQVSVARTEILDTTTTMIAQERQERMQADEALRTDLRALRGALDSLRSEFDVRITQVAEGLKFMMPVNFAFDDATVREEDKPSITRFAQVVQQHYPNAKITVEGFADPAGSRNYNINLSQRRAESVKQYLSEAGLMGDMVATVAYGETRQVVPGAERDDPGAEKNRRVTFVIEGVDVSNTGIAVLP
ncbi:MAG TPA: OmpA family protein [Gemmatimonadaceae bacterium]|nr:OmpA family protein [Gemmatimonadaceae bacterium]